MRSSMPNHILLFEVVKFAGKVQSNGFPPKSVAELRKPTEHHNPSSFQHYSVREEVKFQECSVHYNCGHEYDNYPKYSESVPLLRKERALQPSTSHFHQRATQSLMVLTF